MISEICSKEVLFFWTFLQIEKGVFSLPIISAFILYSFKSSLNCSDIELKVLTLLSLISSNLFFISSRA